MTAASAALSLPLDSVSRHGGTIRSRQPLIVETSLQPWDYAVSLVLAHVDHRPPPLFLNEAAIVTVSVEAGELSLLLVGDDWSTAIGEVPPSLGEGTHTVAVTWRWMGQVARLVFRNTGSGGGPCVFCVHEVVLPAPLLLPAAKTGLQFVTDGWNQSGPVMRLLLSPDSVNLHNSAQHVGDELEFISDPPLWGYSTSVTIDVPPEPSARVQPLVIVDVHVLDGVVGIGALDENWERFVTPEIDTRASDEPTRVELPLVVGDSRVHVMIRNAFDAGPSRFRLLRVTVQFVAKRTELLTARELPAIAARIDAAATVTASFDILISHSSRYWVGEQCERGYLRQRWAKPGRHDALPAFETLPPHAAPYYGLLSVFRIELSGGRVTGRLLHNYVSSEKVVHAAVMGRSVVVAFDDGAALFDRRDGDCIEIVPESGRRLADPWFGGLHTVMAIDETMCLLSSSGADAVLWLDTSSGTVVRRWRLPADRYGTNYDLDEHTWLNEHYVPNDFQLGHLNCASPDGQGGAYVSVLGQGDIGHINRSGGFELLATDFVGCHGVRLAREHGLLYFCDSCSGRLMRVEGRDRVTPLFDTGSRWLHDAVHLTAGLFLMTAGDRNGLVLADVEHGRSLAEWDFSAAGGTIQFLSVAASRLG
jgi:hypothetical protein